MKRAEAIQLTQKLGEKLSNYFRTQSYGINCGKHWAGLEVAKVAEETISVTTANVRPEAYKSYPEIVHAQYVVRASKPSHVFPSLFLIRRKTELAEKTETLIEFFQNFFTHGEIVNLSFCPFTRNLSCVVKAYGKFFHIGLDIVIQGEVQHA